MTLAEPQAGERCPDCGHRMNDHRANGITNVTPLDAAVPCFAVVEELPAKPGIRRWRYCECTYLTDNKGDGQ